MIEGLLGNMVIASAPYQQIAQTDFNQQRQTNKQGQQTMERSKILFGVSDPIDLVHVKVAPPSFKGSNGASQAGLNQFVRSYTEDLLAIPIPPSSELENIHKKSLHIRNKYLLKKESENLEYNEGQESISNRSANTVYK